MKRPGALGNFVPKVPGVFGLNKAQMFSTNTEVWLETGHRIIAQVPPATIVGGQGPGFLPAVPSVLATLADCCRTQLLRASAVCLLRNHDLGRIPHVRHPNKLVAFTLV